MDKHLTRCEITDLYKSAAMLDGMGIGFDPAEGRQMVLKTGGARSPITGAGAL